MVFDKPSSPKKDMKRQLKFFRNSDKKINGKIRQAIVPKASLSAPAYRQTG
jgi:hypothetical protein